MQSKSYFCNLKTVFLVLVSLLGFWGCTTTDTVMIDCKLTATDEEVVLYYDQEYEVIYRIKFSVQAELDNQSFLRKTLRGVRYNPDTAVVRKPTFNNRNNSYVRILSSGSNLVHQKPHKDLYYKSTASFTLYPSMRVDCLLYTSDAADD